jgi:Fe-S-cluster-containing dehydrogenase component
MDSRVKPANDEKVKGILIKELIYMAENNKILVNLERCIGCWSCAMACKVGNGLDDDTWWATVRTLGNGEGIDRPAGVYPKLSMGWQPVWSDKCIFCAKRVKDGDEPYCVYNCPTFALTFGEDKVADEAAKLRGEGYQLFEMPKWEGTKKGILYASKK